MQGMQLEKEAQELEFVLRVTGIEGEAKASVKFEFDPPIGKEGENHWENSGAGNVAALIMDVIKNTRQGF